jgi:PKHD-type hydroxylase
MACKMTRSIEYNLGQGT